jgi:hypothetical protein
MKFNLLFLLPLALSVSAGVVGRDGEWGYQTCSTVTKTATSTTTATATTTETATVTATKTVTATVTSCESYGYPKVTYRAS